MRTRISELRKAVMVALFVALTLTSCTDSGTDPGGTTTEPSVTQTETTVASTGDGRFTIVGGDIVGPDGNVFVPIGANVAVRQGQYETGYTFNWNGTATGHAADVAAWGWNTVRPTLICNPPGNPSIADLNAGIDAFIEEYTALGIVVMIECHDVTGKNLGPTSPGIAAILPFWDRLATRWKDNPYVWFNFVNEPQTGASPADVDNWLNLQRWGLQRLRGIAPSNIFVADIPRYGQGVETFTGSNSILRLGQGQCNVLYSWHAYGAVGENGVFGEFADYANETASRANHLEAIEWITDNDVPVVIGEFGDPLTLNEGTAGLPIWNRIGARAVMDYAPDAGIGLIWWHATGDSGVFLTYSLMADRHAAPWSAASTGAGLSDAGQRFWNVSKNAAPPVKFTGNLGDSNC